jgi:hypothetical protein
MKEFQKALTVLDSFIKNKAIPTRQLVPLLESVKKKINEDNEELNIDDQYLSRIRHMTENYTIQMEYAKVAHQEKTILMNTTVSCSWINTYLNSMHDHIYKIQDKINKKLEEYEAIAKEYNVNINNELDKIKNQISEYEQSETYKTFDSIHTKKVTVLYELINYLNVLDRNSWDLARKDEIPMNTFIGQNYPTDFRKSPELSELVTILDKVKEEFKEFYLESKLIVDDTSLMKLINETDDSFKNMYSKLRNAGYNSCMANVYEAAQNDKSVIGFLKNKDENVTITSETELPEWSRLSKIVLFKDHSLLIKNKENEMKEIVSMRDAIIIRESLINDYIQNKFSRKPTIGHIFKKMNTEMYVDEISSLERVTDNYLKNEGILKLYNFDIAKAFKEACKDQKYSYRAYEHFDDSMAKIVHHHQVKKFIHAIASNKYSHLYNDETYKLASEIYDLNLPDNSLQDYIGKKLAAFKTPEQFNEALGLFLESLNSFTMAATINKANTYGVDIISEYDNKLILKINNFEQSKIMGSSAWCISRTESYFHSYADDREQYFIYDFDKDTTDSTSLVGVTLETSGEYSVACYKDDTECEEDDPIVSYVQEEVYEYKAKIEATNKSKLKI